MRSSFFARALGVATVSLVIAAARPAAAQSPPPPPQQDYQKQPVQGPQYTAPIYQQTQPSYVPQSVALSGPREIKDWSEGDPIPPGYRPVERTRTGLVVGGAVTFGVLYLFSALAASIGADTSGNGKNELAPLYIPAFGPFIQMANTDSSTGKFFLAIDGIGQTAGAAMLIIGLTSPRTVLVRNDLAEIRLAPVLTKDARGVGLVGSF